MKINLAFAGSALTWAVPEALNWGANSGRDSMKWASTWRQGKQGRAVYDVSDGVKVIAIEQERRPDLACEPHPVSPRALAGADHAGPGSDQSPGRSSLMVGEATLCRPRETR
jgi:hypothetical protein